MKLLIENWRGYLNEIGEASIDPFEYNLSGSPNSERVSYRFNSDEYEYEVYFARENEDDDTWEITFEAGGSATIETGENQPLKIMSTVLRIIKEFINSQYNLGIRKYVFMGELKGSEFKNPNRLKPSSRTKLYLAYLKKHLPSAKITIDPFNFGEDASIIGFELPTENEDKEQETF